VVKQLLLSQVNVDIKNNELYSLPSPLSAQSLVLDAHVRVGLDESPDWSVHWVSLFGWYGWWLLYGKHVPAGLCISNANGKISSLCIP
jgi:hypothetical protein